MNEQSEVVARLRMLGLACDEVSRDKLDSAIVALSCFPMYMVANIHAWTSDDQWRIPLLDLPGSEAIREALAIGKQEAQLPMNKEHRRVLGTMLSNPKPADRVIYQYAIDTLRRFLDIASPEVVDQIRVAVAKTTVAVAKASGEGFLGSGNEVSAAERDGIEHIASELLLREAAAAAEILESMETEDGPQLRELETVATFWDVNEAYVARIKLKDNGIECFLQNEMLIGVGWHLANATGGVQVQVERSDAPRARELLAAKKELSGSEGTDE